MTMLLLDRHPSRSLETYKGIPHPGLVLAMTDLRDLARDELLTAMLSSNRYSTSADNAVGVLRAKTMLKERVMRFTL